MLRPHDRPVPRALTKASTGGQLLVVGGSSAVGGWTTNVDHGDDRWVALLGPLGRIVIPKLTYVTDICNGRCMLHIISQPYFECFYVILPSWNAPDAIGSENAQATCTAQKTHPVADPEDLATCVAVLEAASARRAHLLHRSKASLMRPLMNLCIAE